MIYVICHKTDYLEYILNGINVSDISIINLNEKCNFIQKLLRKVWPFTVSLPIFFLGRHIRQILKTLRSQDSLLVIDYRNRNLISSLSKATPIYTRKYLWFWNPFKGKSELDIKKDLNFIRKNGFEICSFNSNDSARYGFTYLNQFYKMFPDQISENEIIYDFYFLGYAKDRTEDLFVLKSRLNKFRNFFKIVRRESERITYKKNIELINSSRCIVDLVQKNQIGISLRPLEALAFNKKLLTNNEDIINYEFYDHRNIFILGKDDYCELEYFLASETYPIANSVKFKYDVNYWIRNFNK